MTVTINPDTVVWQDASTSNYTADVAMVNGHAVVVCLDDEGPMSPAFYWDIDNRTIEGWASTVKAAKKAAIKAAIKAARSL